MASGAKLVGRDCDSAYIPSDVSHRIDFIADSIRNRICAGAFRRAKARKSVRGEKVVTGEDVLQEACVVLRSTATELEQELNRWLTRDVRVRNAS